MTSSKGSGSIYVYYYYIFDVSKVKYLDFTENKS